MSIILESKPSISYIIIKGVTAIMEEKKVEKVEIENKETENKGFVKSNPVPYLIITLLICIFALVYYNVPRLKPEKEVQTVTNSSTEPIVITVVEEDKDKTKVRVEEVENLLEGASDLITSRYHYTNAADFDSVLTWFGSTLENPFTRSKGYIIYDGVVSVGIDISDVKIDVDNNQDIITVYLPEIKVLAHEIDDSSVKADSKESVFNTLDGEYYAKLIAGFKKETEEKIMGNEDYLKEVRKNTELVIGNLLKSEGILNGYEIVFI